MDCEDDSDEHCLTTPRLRLRPLVMGDAAAMARIANDRHIAEMTTRIPHPYRLADARAFIAQHVEERRFAVIRRADEAFAGVVGLIPRGPEALELGYWLGRPFWGQGLATEAAQASVDHAFAALSSERVEVRCRVVNTASRRVIQKCGFQYAGTGMETSLSAGRVATERFTMDRRCWLSLKAWGGR